MGNRSLAYLISRILGPLPLACLLWLVTALKSGIGFYKALWVYPLIFFITIAVPTLITSYLIAIKKVRSIEWPDLKERKKYLPPISIISIFFLTSLTYFLTNQTIFHLSLLLGINILVLIFIWTFLNYKVSAHVGMATFTFAGVNLFFHFKFWWLFVLLIPIIWARYVLKMHTLSQLIAGFILPAAIGLLALLLFGYPAVP